MPMTSGAQDADPRFDGIDRLYGRGAVARLRASHVMVIGLGGVGSWTVEALARSGVGRLTLVDLDEVCVSNTNRQLHATTAAVGRFKAEVLAERVAAIAPDCVVHVVLDFATPTTLDRLLDGDGAGPAAGARPAPALVVDAFDQAANKVALLLACQRRGLPLLVVGGAGGRRDPGRIQTTDLTESVNDGLLRRVRKTLRRQHGFAEQGPWGVRCISSRERAVFPLADGRVCEAPLGEDGLPVAANGPNRLDCSGGYGAASFVTGSFGFAAAAEAVRLLLVGAVEDVVAAPSKKARRLARRSARAQQDGAGGAT